MRHIAMLAFEDVQALDVTGPLEVFSLATRLAGLLDGRRATTHWAECDRLAAAYPGIEVDPEPIFVRDGHVYTSAGVTAGIDLALALVEEDLGRQASQAVARQLVVYMRRPGAQAQMSAGLAGQACGAPLLHDLQDWIAEHLDDDLSVPALAERVFMSPRHFARVFKRHDARQLRRGDARRACRHAAGHYRSATGRDRPAVRLRNCRDAAQDVRPAHAAQPRGLPP
jgi:DJ-1/PfpI family protein